MMAGRVGEWSSFANAIHAIQVPGLNGWQAMEIPTDVAALQGVLVSILLGFDNLPG
jgi:hypothetical protein